VRGNVPWRCRDGQVERLASRHEDVLWAVVEYILVRIVKKSLLDDSDWSPDGKRIVVEASSSTTES